MDIIKRVNFILDQIFPKPSLPFRITMNDDQIRPLVMTTKGMRYNSLHKITFSEFTEVFFENYNYLLTKS